MVASAQEQLLHSSFDKLDFDVDAKSSTPENPNHDQKTHAKKEKSVRFAHDDEVYDIPHINDLSDEEVEDVWMSPDDFVMIQRECRKIIMAMERGYLDELQGVELRGIEKHLKSQREQANKTIITLYDTVEKLQTIQDETGMDVSHRMGRMCGKISARAVRKAHQMALADEDEANV